MPVEYGGHYSFTDCLIKCKIRNYISLCGCIPFNLPTNFPDFPPEIRKFMRCNLSHIRCLQKYKSKIKLYTYIPPFNFKSALEGLNYIF